MADKSTYTGGWVYNKIEGYGEYNWPDGRVYKGGWKQNNMEG